MKTCYQFILSVLAAVSIISCNNDPGQMFFLGGGSETLVPFENSGVVGAAGGVVAGGDESSPQGSKTFVQVPEGALTADVTITVKSVDPAVEGITYYGSPANYFVEFGPHGTEFEKSVVISIPYKHVEHPEAQRLFYFNADKNTWEEVQVLANDRENRVILAEVRHFSVYTVASTNILLDIDLYKNAASNLFGAVKLLTPWDQIDLGPDGMMNELMAAHPMEVRAAFRVTLKRELGHGIPPWVIGGLDWLNPVIATRTIYYRVDQVAGSIYSVEAEDESAAVLMNTMSDGINLDFAGVERYFSGEPLLFDFGVTAEDDRQYYLSVDMYYLKNGVSLDTMTPADLWGTQGYTVVAYNGAQMLPAMPPVTDVDANGDGVVDHAADGYGYDLSPAVAISSPSDGAVFLEGSSVTFTASAADHEDGALPGSAITWTSDRDGVIGTGESFDISTLSINTHIITCSAVDSAGNTGSAGVRVIVSADPPVITARIPGDGATGVPIASCVYVTFNKDMDQATMNEETFQVRDGNGDTVTGLLSYDSRVATFMPVPSLRYNTQYSVTVTTGVHDDFGTPMAADVSWTFRTRSNEVQLEPAAYHTNGAAYFGGPTRKLARTSGENLAEGVDYIYGDDILDIYDLGVGGDFAEERYIRIVEDTLNVADSDGLGLTPVAVDLNTWVAPRSDQCFIDPARSKFTMPRPSYWSRMESWDGILVSPEIGEGTPATSQDIVDTFAGINSAASHTEEFITGSGLANCMHTQWVAQGGYVGAWGQSTGNRNLYPFGTGVTRDISRGTLSFYGKIDTLKTRDDFGVCGGNSRIEWRLISDIVQVRIYNVNTDGVDTGMQAEIWMFNGTDMVLVAGPVNFGAINTWYHIYVEWDIDESMENRSVVVSVNNDEVLYTTTDLPGTLRHAVDPYIQACGYTYAWGATAEWVSLIGAIQGDSYIDNVKWFNHVVKNNGQPAGPGWEYARITTGHDDAVHAVYGTSGNYRPVLDGGTSGVGYFFNPVQAGVSDQPTAPANLREQTTGSSTGHLTWDSSIDPDGTVIGYDIYMSLASGSGYTKIGTSYVNEYAVDDLSPYTPAYFVVRAVDDTGVESEASNELTVNIEPEMQVTGEGGLDVPGGSEIQFRTMVRSKVLKTLLIHNRGDINLELTGTPPAQITGPDADSFFIFRVYATTVKPSGMTAVTVGFMPVTPGTKTATLTIPNGDADEGSYTLTLTGTSYYGRMDLGLYNPNKPTTFFQGGDFILKLLDPNGAVYKSLSYQWDSIKNAEALSGDFNCDGVYDLVLRDDDSFMIRFGYDSNHFGGQRNYTWIPGGKSFTGDFNRDGFSDLGLYNVGDDGRIRIRYGYGNGDFINETVYDWGNYPDAQVMAGDYNGDGYFDICLFNAERAGDFRIRYGDGTGSFGGETIDPRWDIWPEANNIKVQFTCGIGAICWYNYQSYHTTSRAYSGDFNGDGIWDLGIYYVNMMMLIDPYGHGNEMYDATRSGYAVTRNGNGDGTFANQKYNLLIDDYGTAAALALGYFSPRNQPAYATFWGLVYFDYCNYKSGLLSNGRPISGNFDRQ